MRMLDRNSFLEIRTWIYRNARPLEMALWNYTYENGNREAVINALSCYQNEDGGFGNGIEPDCLNTESSPYATLKAIELLRKTRIVDEIGSGHPLIQGIFRYLKSGSHESCDGWLFCIPSNDSFPRAPWWTYSEETNQVQSMGITSGLCAFILRYGAEQTGLYEKSLEYARKILNKIAETDDFGEMGIGGVTVLMGDMLQCALDKSYDFPGIMAKLKAVVNRMIERNPDNWQYYTPRPSVFIWSKESPFYEGNEEIVEAQLDYLIDTRKAGGVWGITWSWFDLGEMYSKEFAVSENWWMSTVAIDNLEFLGSFGRIDKESAEVDTTFNFL